MPLIGICVLRNFMIYGLNRSPMALHHLERADLVLTEVALPVKDSHLIRNRDISYSENEEAHGHKV